MHSHDNVVGILHELVLISVTIFFPLCASVLNESGQRSGYHATPGSQVSMCRHSVADSENQFPNRVCQRGALRCQMVSCDAMTSGFVSDLFTSSRSSHKTDGKCMSCDNGYTT